MTFWHSPPLPSRVHGPSRSLPPSISPFAIDDSSFSLEWLGVLLLCGLFSFLISEVQSRWTSKSNLASKLVVAEEKAEVNGSYLDLDDEQDNDEQRYLACFPDLSRAADSATDRERIRMMNDKDLYWKLQNEEDHPDVIDEAKSRLLELLDKTLSEAACDRSQSILSLDQYDQSALRSFLHHSHSSAATRYETYLERRKAGGPREMFPTVEFAKEWLRLAAVVKYVDGGWIGAILNAGNARAGRSDRSLERKTGKMAWQVISEEFGDGDLEKNHVHLYEDLISGLNTTSDGGVGAGGEGTSPGNVRGLDGTKDDQGVPRCWEAAVAQQCIGILASTDDFFPEALGFNMAYESLPYHLLVTTHELGELRLNNYYFAIHVTIDNADSGHSAMARLAVEKYLQGVKQRDGQQAMEIIWKRVQAGYILAEGLPTTPSGPQEFESYSNSNSNGIKRWRQRIQVQSATNDAESKMVEIILRKSTAASKMHCTSRMLISGQTVEQWLEPSTLTKEKGLAFIRALADKRPYVIPGEVEKSRLVRDMEWGGRMFGAFSQNETEVVREWVKSLCPRLSSEGAYQMHLGISNQKFSRVAHKPVVETPFSHDDTITHGSPSLEDILSFQYESTNIKTTFDFDTIAPIWFTSISILERFPLSPSKFASPLGMIVLRIIRSQLGFSDLHRGKDICAGTDDSVQDIIGLWEVGEKVLGRPVNLYEMLQNCQDSNTNEYARQLLNDWSRRPYTNSAKLLGATLAFSRKLHGSPSFLALLPKSDTRIVQRIVREQEEAILEYLHDMSLREEHLSLRDFGNSYKWTSEII